MQYCPSPYEAAREADALLILTEWREYREMDFARLHELMDVPVIIDGRNLLDSERLRAIGFEYVGMGRNLPGSTVARSAGIESVGDIWVVEPESQSTDSKALPSEK